MPTEVRRGQIRNVTFAQTYPRRGMFGGRTLKPRNAVAGTRRPTFGAKAVLVEGLSLYLGEVDKATFDTDVDQFNSQETAHLFWTESADQFAFYKRIRNPNPRALG